jgi:hypothetical protein
MDNAGARIEELRNAALRAEWQGLTLRADHLYRELQKAITARASSAEEGE